jgi:hypothetical protein
LTSLTPKRFDEIVSPLPAREPRIIWTLPAIGRRVGRGKAFAAALASTPGTPIKRRGRQYFVDESELLAFMRG